MYAKIRLYHVQIARWERHQGHFGNLPSGSFVTVAIAAPPAKYYCDIILLIVIIAMLLPPFSVGSLVVITFSPIITKNIPVK